MPPTGRTALPTKTVDDAAYVSLSERMAQDYFRLGASHRAEQDAASLASVIQVPETGGITGTTGYEGALSGAEWVQPDIAGSPDEAPAFDTQMPPSVSNDSAPRRSPMMAMPAAPELAPLAPRQPMTPQQGQSFELPGSQPTAPVDVSIPAATSGSAQAIPVPGGGGAPRAPGAPGLRTAAGDLDPAALRSLPRPAVDPSQGGDAVLRQLAPSFLAVEQAGGPSARNLGALVLAENGGGQSPLSARDNNYFSISHVPGRDFQAGPGTGGRFARYESPNESLADFVDLIKTSPRYQEAWALRNAPPAQFFGALARAGYIVPEAGFPVETWLQNTAAGADRYDRAAAGAVAAGLPSGPPVPPSATQGASELRHASGELQGITPPQFGLGDADADSICGPVLAMAFAKANGRNPTIAEAKQMATQNGGWTSTHGMGGPEAMAQTLRAMNIPAHYAPGALDIDTIRRETQNGNPVGINTAGHYFVVEGVDADGRLDLGNSAKALRASGGRQWFRPDEIPGLGMGAPTGAIYKDAPSSPTPSVAVSQTGLPAVAHPEARQAMAPEQRRDHDAMSLATLSDPGTGAEDLRMAQAARQGYSDVSFGMGQEASAPAERALSEPASRRGPPARDDYRNDVVQPQFTPSEPASRGDPDQGPRELGYSLPAEPPSAPPAQPGLLQGIGQGLWDAGAGAVGAVQDAYAVPPEQRPPQYNGPSYAQPALPEGQRPYVAPTETEQAAFGQGIEDARAAAPVERMPIPFTGATVPIPGPLQQPAGAAAGALGALNAADQAVRARIDPRVWGFAHDGIRRELFTPEQLQRESYLRGAMDPETGRRHVSLTQDEQDELAAMDQAVEQRYQQIKDDPDALTRYANASPAYGPTSAITDIALTPALGAAAGSAATRGAEAAGASSRTARAIGYGADIAAQTVVDPTTPFTQGPLDAAVAGARRAVGAARALPGQLGSGTSTPSVARSAAALPSLPEGSVRVIHTTPPAHAAAIAQTGLDYSGLHNITNTAVRFDRAEDVSGAIPYGRDPNKVSVIMDMPRAEYERHLPNDPLTGERRGSDLMPGRVDPRYVVGVLPTSELDQAGALARQAPPPRLSNAQRVARADARMAEQGSTAAPGVLGALPDDIGRTLGQVADDVPSLPVARQALRDAQAVGDPEAIAAARQQLGQAVDAASTGAPRAAARSIETPTQTLDYQGRTLRVEPTDDPSAPFRLTSPHGEPLTLVPTGADGGRRYFVQRPDGQVNGGTVGQLRDGSLLHLPTSGPQAAEATRIWRADLDAQGTGTLAHATLGAQAPTTARRDPFAIATRAISGPLAGSIGGATIGGGLPAESDEERRANALRGAAIGAVGFPAATRLARGAARLAGAAPSPGGGALASAGGLPEPPRGPRGVPEPPAAARAPKLPEGALPIKLSAAEEVARLRTDLQGVPEDAKALLEQAARDENWYHANRRGVLPDDVVARMADEAGRSVEQTIRRGQVGRAWSAEETVALRNAVAGQTVRVNDLGAAVGQATSAEAPGLIAEFTHEAARLSDLMGVMEGARAEAGRSLRQWGLPSRAVDDPASFAGAVIKKFGGDSQKALGAIAEYNQMIRDGATPAQMAGFWQQVMADPVAPAEIFSLYRRFNMLSGPRTLEVNAISGGLELGYDAAQRVGGRLVTGRPGEAAEIAAAPFIALGRAGRNFVETLARGVTSEQAARGDLPRAISSRMEPGLGRRAVQVMEVPDRLNAATDQFVRTLAEQMIATDSALRATRGLSGDARAARMADLLKAPTRAMAEEITAGADRITFQGDLGRMGRALRGVQQVPIVGNVLIPFLTTVYHITARGIDRSPLGLLTTGQELLRSGPGKLGEIGQGAYRAGQPLPKGVPALGARLRDNAIGTAVAVWAYDQAEQGAVTGMGPDDPEQRAQLMATGWRPYSVRFYSPISGQTEYWSYANLGPLAFPLAQAAAASEAKRFAADDASTVALIGDAGKRFASMVTETSVVSGIGALVKGLQDPDRYGGQWLTQAAQTLIPGGAALNTVGQAMDPTVRRADRADLGTQLVQGVEARIPPNPLTPDRTDVPAAQDPFGRDIPNEQTGLGALHPFRPSAVKNDQSAQMAQAFLDVGVDVGAPPSAFTEDGVKIEMTPDQQRTYRQYLGDEIEKGFNRANNASDRRRAEMLRDLYTAARATAQERIKHDIGRSEIRERVRAGSGR